MDFEILRQVTTVDTINGSGVHGVFFPTWYVQEAFASADIAWLPSVLALIPGGLVGPLTITERITLLDCHDFTGTSYTDPFIADPIAFALHGLSAIASSVGNITGKMRWDAFIVDANGVSWTGLSTFTPAVGMNPVYGSLQIVNGGGLTIGSQPIDVGNPSQVRTSSASRTALWFGQPVQYGNATLTEFGYDTLTGAGPTCSAAIAASGPTVSMVATSLASGTVGRSGASALAQAELYPGHAYSLKGDLVRTEAADLSNAVVGTRVLVAVGTQGGSLSVEEHTTPLNVVKAQGASPHAIASVSGTRKSPLPPSVQQSESGATYAGLYPFPVQVRMPRKSMGIIGETFTSLRQEFFNGCTTQQEILSNPATGVYSLVPVDMVWPMTLDSSFDSRAIPIRTVRMDRSFTIGGTWSSGNRSVYTGTGVTIGYRYLNLHADSDRPTSAVLKLRVGNFGPGATDVTKFYNVQLVAGGNVIRIDLTNPDAIQYTTSGPVIQTSGMAQVEGYGASTLRYTGCPSVASGSSLDGGTAIVRVSSLECVVVSSAYLQQGGEAAQNPGGQRCYQIVVDGWVARIFGESQDGRFDITSGGQPGPWFFARSSGIHAVDVSPAHLSLGDWAIAHDDPANPFIYADTKHAASRTSCVEWTNPGTGVRRPSIDLLVGGTIYGFPAQQGAGMLPGAHLIFGKTLDFYSQYVYGYEIQTTPIPGGRRITGFTFQFTNNSSPSPMRDRGDGLWFHDSFPIPSDLPATDLFEWTFATGGSSSEPPSLVTPLGFSIPSHLRVVRNQDSPFALRYPTQGTQWGGWVWCAMVPKSDQNTSLELLSQRGGDYHVAYVDSGGLVMTSSTMPNRRPNNRTIIDASATAAHSVSLVENHFGEIICTYIISGKLYARTSWNYGKEWGGWPDLSNPLIVGVTHQRTVFNRRTKETTVFCRFSDGSVKAYSFDLKGLNPVIAVVGNGGADDAEIAATYGDGETGFVDVSFFVSGVIQIWRSRDESRQFAKFLDLTVT